MTFLPIVARELRVASRRRATYWGRLWAATVAIAIAGFWLPVAVSVSTSQGQVLFAALSGLGFAYCLLTGARVTSDCISVEKREGTIGLLFLTDLKGYDVVLGKLVSRSLNAIYGLLGLLPVLSLALLLGGVTLTEVQRMALVFFSTLALSLSAGVFASTLSRNDRRAMFAAVCIVIVVTATPYTVVSLAMYLEMLANRTPNLMEFNAWLRPSPAFAFHMATQASLNRALRADFAESIAAIFGMAFVLLAAASALVSRTCRERPRTQRQNRWLEFRNRWTYGAPAKRQEWQRRSLDRNAFYWLSARDRVKGWYVWLFLGALALIWVWMVWVMGGVDWQISLCLLFICFVVLKVWVASEVSTRLVEARESGVFELLLASPLQPKELAHGQWLALRRQFGLPLLICLGLSLLLLEGAVNSWRGEVSSGEVRLAFWAVILMLVADLAALRWVASWHALQSAQIQKAALAACARIQLLPTVVFVVVYNFAFTLAQASDQAAFSAGVILWLVIGLLNALWFGVSARWSFLHHFRALAAERYAPRTSALEPFAELLRRAWMRVRPARAATPAAPAQRRRWQYALALSLPVALAVLALGLWTWKHSLQNGIAAELSAIKAARQPLSLPELDDWGPVIQDQDNAALVVQRAMWKLTYLPPAPRGMAGVGKLEWPGATATLPPAQEARVSAWVATNREALNLIARAARMPQCRYRVFWGQTWPSSATWQTFGRLTPLADLLQFDALHRSDAGDGDGAVACVETLLGIARGLADQPLLAAQTQRRIYVAAAVRVTQRILNQHTLREDQLQALSSWFAPLEEAAPRAMARAFVGERCLGLEEARLSGRQSPFFRAAPSGLPKLQMEMAEFFAEASGVRDQWRFDYLRAISGCISNALELRSGAAPELLRAPTAHNPKVRMIGREQLAASRDYWTRILQQELETLGRIRLARAAMAVELFRRCEAEQRPENLLQLGWLETAATRDPFSDRSLRYVLLPVGYLLYSVGLDQKDDGGAELDPRPVNTGFIGDLTFRVER